MSSTKTTRSFYLPEWSDLGTKLDQTKLQIRAEEHRIFKELRELVSHTKIFPNQSLTKRRWSPILSNFDAMPEHWTNWTSRAPLQPLPRSKISSNRFSILGRLLYNLGKTSLTEKSCSHKIVGGRHPMVKVGLEEQGRTFVSNDCFVGDVERIWLITG